MTAAGGGRKEQFCGGGTELKEALLGDAQRRFRRVLKGSVFAEEEQSAEQRRRGDICVARRGKWGASAYLTC